MNSVSHKMPQFAVRDLAILLAAHSIAIAGIVDVFQSLKTDRDPRSSTQVKQIVNGVLVRSPIPDQPPAQSFTINGVGTFTPYWFRIFVGALVLSVAMVALPFFSAALFSWDSMRRVAYLTPSALASLACLMYLTLLSLAAHTINARNGAGFRCIGIAAAAAIFVLYLELAFKREVRVANAH
jgi:hypothetical protein